MHIWNSSELPELGVLEALEYAKIITSASDYVIKTNNLKQITDSLY